MVIIIAGVLIVGAFVAGVLVGRANPKKTERVVSEVKSRFGGG
jgi:hypothetical protein